MLNVAQGFVYNKFQKPNDWPKIEDTFDYKYANGKLIGGNKNLYLSGPVTYEKVGNPVIVDGIASGFSANDYLTIPALPSTAYEIEINLRYIIKVKSASLWRNIFSDDTTQWRFNIQFIANRHRITYLTGNSSTEYYQLWEINPEIGDSCNFNCKITGSGISVVFKNLTTGLIWTGSIETSVSLSTFYDNLFCFGRTNELENIDLKHTYIKVNGHLWFYGKNYTTSNMVPVPKGLEYNNTTAPSNGWVYTNSDLVKGHVNYTVVGSPTITNGVVNGFSSHNYLNTSSLLPMALDTFEIVTRAKRLTGGSNFVMAAGDGRALRITLSNTTILAHCNNGVSLSIAGTFDQETYYYIRLRKNNNTFILDYSLDGVSYSSSVETVSSETAIQSSVIRFGVAFYYSDTGFGGIIDLNQTYIKVNGQPWFGNVSRFQEFIPAPEEAQIGKDDTTNLVVETPIVNGELLSPKMVGPVNYTIVGSPTIVDGIASGFSSGNYLTMPSFNPGNNPWEMVLCIKSPQESDMNSWQIAFGTKTSNQKGVRIITGFSGSSKFFQVIFTGPSGQIGYIGLASTTPIQPNTKTWIKTTFNGSVYKVYTSLNGSDYTEIEKTVTSSTSISSDNSEYHFGEGLSSSSDSLPYKGFIDLNETYIKVNGKLWFGKEDWIPSTYTDNAIYLLGSHSTDYSSYNTLEFTPTVSDNANYDVWIDNQKLFENENGGTSINWQNLGLTTGYSITTPSTLKAHTIKITPTNSAKNIIAYKGYVDVVFPTLEYTIAGQPSIVDGVVSNFSVDNYLVLGTTISSNSEYKFVFKATTGTISQSDATTNHCLVAAYSGNTKLEWYIQSNTKKLRFYNGSTAVDGSTVLQNNTTYWFALQYANGTTKWYVDNGTHASLSKQDVPDLTDTTFWSQEGSQSTNYFSGLSISIGYNKFATAEYWKNTIDVQNSYFVQSN